MIIEPSETGSDIPWVEKYRPKSPEDLISNNNVIGTLDKFISEKNLPHQLFYGPPGTGKTSTIMAYARKVYGRAFKFMVLELNASDDRGIDIVRNNIKTFAETRSAVTNDALALKLIILDEADAMTKDAQAALRRTMEKFSRTVRFCLIGNHATNIIPALQSRCTKFKFTQIPVVEALRKVDLICRAEGLELTQPVREEIIRVAQGDMRKVINTLQSVFLASQYAPRPFLQRVEELYAHLGMISPGQIREVFEALLRLGFNAAQAETQRLLAQADADVGSLLEELAALVAAADLLPRAKIALLKCLKETEHRCSLTLGEGLLRDFLVAGFVAGRR